MFGLRRKIAKNQQNINGKKSLSTNRRTQLWLEALEERCTPTASIVDTVGGVPIPAGATLLASNGKQLLFESTDPNVVANEGPVGEEQLYWEDATNPASPTIKLVTSVAGSTNTPAGFEGVGKGFDPAFSGTAFLSADGRFVVFDSSINANKYDTTVPAANDQADGLSQDTFYWDSTTGVAHAVDLLNTAGQTAAGTTGPTVVGTATHGMYNTGSTTTKAIFQSSAGTVPEVLITSNVNATFIDNVNASILDATPDLDAYLANPSGNTIKTVTVDHLGNALGNTGNTLDTTGSSSGDVKLGNNGNLVAYDTTAPVNVIVASAIQGAASVSNVFVNDLADASGSGNTLISVSTTANTSGNVGAELSALSGGTGETVVFAATGTSLTTPNFVANFTNARYDANNYADLYAFNLSATTPAPVLVNTPDGTHNTNTDLELNNVDLPFATVTPDGSQVYFGTTASNLTTSTPIGGFNNLFARNINTSATSLISVAANGTSSDNGNVNWSSFPVGVSTSGQYVLFASTGNNLVNGLSQPGNGSVVQLFLRNTKTGVTTMITSLPAGNVASTGQLEGTFFLSVNESTGIGFITFSSTDGSLQRQIANPTSAGSWQKD